MVGVKRDHLGVLDAAAGNVPQRCVVALGKLLGRVAYFVDTRHRRIALRNLRFCFPEWSQGEVTDFSRRVFENLGITVVEMAQMTLLNREDVVNRVRIRGAEHLKNALAQRKGVIVVSAHLGNWEMAMLAWAARFKTPVTVVMKRLAFEPFNRWTENLRKPFGIQIIWKKGAFPDMVCALRAGNMLVVALDLQRGKNQTEIQFLGKRATVTHSAAMLARRCKSLVVPAFCYRESDGALSCEIKPPLDLKWTGSLRADLQVNSQLMSDAIEEAVRRYPDQWLWLQKRWKAFYPHLYPEYWAGRRRRKESKRKRQQRNLQSQSASLHSPNHQPSTEPTFEEDL